MTADSPDEWADPDAADPEWWQVTDDDRVAERRAQYLNHTTRWGDDERPIMLALAYRQLGFSHTGIASKVRLDASTVAAYMDEIAAAHSQRVVETSLPSELAEWPSRPLETDSHGGRHE
ncbi:MAG: hypothetical protein V5A21_05840 [Halapricum sp.]